MIVDPFAYSKEFRCRIAGTDRKLNEETASGSVHDLIEIVIICVPAAWSILNIRQNFAHYIGSKACKGTVTLCQVHINVSSFD